MALSAKNRKPTRGPSTPTNRRSRWRNRSQPLAGENVAPARDTASALRFDRRRPRKGVDARAYLDSRTKINGKLSFEGLCRSTVRSRAR